LRLWRFTAAKGHGKERRAAHAVHVGEAGDEHDDGKAEADGAERGGAFTGDSSYVNPVYDAVEQAEHLGNQHGEGGFGDAACDFAAAEIDLFHERGSFLENIS